MRPRSFGPRAAVASAGFTLVELLVGTALGLVTAAALTALLAAGAAARVRAADGAEAVAAAAGAVDQVARDVRLAGYDPRALGFAAISGATAATIVLAADLDGDGIVDTGSEEQVGYRVSGGDTLQRTVGRQTLPLLSDLAPDGFRLRYLDAQGHDLDTSVPAALATARVVTVDVELRRTATHPALRLSGGARLLNR